MDDNIEWSVLNEGQLLDAMVGHKPVGVNKYFQMAFICEKFNNSLNRDIHPDRIWAHLETMYNLEVLDESESIPFPNGEKEFYLPEDDFASVIAKRDEERKSQQKGRETPKIVKEIKKEKDDKTPIRSIKDVPRRDSKDSNKDNNKSTLTTVKKETKKEPEKAKAVSKSRNSSSSSKEESSKPSKNKSDETPKHTKRPTRGSLKPDDNNSSGKSSPINTPSSSKRRRI